MMLFRRATLAGIRSGTITVAFRRWRRPTVRAGGTLLTPVGQLSITSVEPVVLDAISVQDARRAGYGTRDALLEELGRRPEGVVYRIEIGAIGPDPRVALRSAPATDEADAAALRERLRRLDERAAGGAWTERTLALLRVHPGVRAGDLCGMVGMTKERFKVAVRKLKNLGLTESLGTGYRLSPRGAALLDALEAEAGTGTNDAGGAP